MQSKRIIILCTVVGGWLSSYTPLLWGVGGFTMASVISGAAGGFVGIWIGFKITRF